MTYKPLKQSSIFLQKTEVSRNRKISARDLVNTLIRHNKKRKSYNIHRNSKKLHLNKLVKKQNVTNNDLRKAIKLQDKSLNDLKKIAKLQRIKNYDDLSKENFIYTLLRSERNPLEDNYMKHINNNSNDRIKNKINEIRIALIKQGNKQNLTNKQKESIYNRLTELAIALDKIEKYKYQNFEDLDYIGIRDIRRR